MASTLLNAPAPFSGAVVRKLSNGLTCIVNPQKSVSAAALQVWTRCGAVDEAPRVFGISHGLEHMVFKGTPTRSASDIARLIESNGGNMNAATQLETTHYYIDVPTEGVGPALDVLADTLLQPTFPEDELDRERQVILEEIRRRDDNPDATLWDEFMSVVFRGTPYGIKVIGTDETVSAMTRADLRDYHAAHYVASKTFIAAAGDLDPERFFADAERLFGRLPAAPAPPPPAVPEPAGGSSYLRLEKPVQMTYLALGVPVVPLRHPDAVALDALADVLSGGYSSRLYQDLRETRKIVLGISCDYVPFSEKGLFAFFAETTPDKGDEARAEIERALAGLSGRPVEAAELERAKTRIKSEWLFGSESPHGQASTLGSLAATGELDLLSGYLGRLEALTPATVMAAYEKHVSGRTLAAVRLDPQP